MKKLIKTVVNILDDNTEQPRYYYIDKNMVYSNRLGNKRKRICHQPLAYEDCGILSHIGGLN